MVCLSKNFKDCLPQILLGPFLNTLYHLRRSKQYAALHADFYSFILICTVLFYCMQNFSQFYLNLYSFILTFFVFIESKNLIVTRSTIHFYRCSPLFGEHELMTLSHVPGIKKSDLLITFIQNSQ